MVDFWRFRPLFSPAVPTTAPRVTVKTVGGE